MVEISQLPILSIKKSGKRKTFDITVKKNHNFIANGVVVHNCFQEQMMFMVNRIGDLSLAETNTFRKVVSKKPVPGDELYEKMMSYKERFIQGAMSKDINKKTANKIWDAIEAFAGYAFNKSHSISYSIISYMTAWLLTYYEPEWLCAYMETQLNNPKDKANAIAEIKSFGYDFEKIDINKATDHWTISDGNKKLMPSFLSCKGVGKTAIREIVFKRPYKDIYDLLWNEDGSWKHSKFNKKNFNVLIQIGAFDSLDCVGEGKLFKNYAHMKRTLLDNWSLIRKKLKKDNFDTQTKKLEELAAETDEADWTVEEKLQINKELMGEMDINLIIPKEVQNKLREKKYNSIDTFPEDRKGALAWFILEDYEKKKTKHGKLYLSLTVSGLTGKQSRIFLWDWQDDFHISINTGYRGWVQQNNFGFSTKIDQIVELPKITNI